MKIVPKINVSNDYLTSGLAEIFKVMSISEKSEECDLILDFSACQFVSPVVILSLLIYLSHCNKNISFTNISPYLETIGLKTSGLSPDKMRRSEFKAILELYKKKTFIPIINFSAQSSNDEKEEVISLVENILVNQLTLSHNITIGLKYIIGEIVDNITEHSESDRGFLLAQAYPKKGFLDICIADRGITLLGSYLKNPERDISSDLEALKAANRRISSKERGEADSRGFGIYTSKKMLTIGLKGQYMMISGNSIYLNGKSYDNFYSLPDKLRWQGTIIGIRIPYQDKDFNYINYIE